MHSIDLILRSHAKRGVSKDEVVCCVCQSPLRERLDSAQSPRVSMLPFWRVTIPRGALRAHLRMRSELAPHQHPNAPIHPVAPVGVGHPTGADGPLIAPHAQARDMRAEAELAVAIVPRGVKFRSEPDRIKE